MTSKLTTKSGRDRLNEEGIKQKKLGMQELKNVGKVGTKNKEVRTNKKRTIKQGTKRESTKAERTKKDRTQIKRRTN